MENKDYAAFIVELKTRIKNAQYQALKAVNKEYIDLCWEIGKSLQEKQEASGWGKSVVEQVARDLQAGADSRHPTYGECAIFIFLM